MCRGFGVHFFLAHPVSDMHALCDQCTCDSWSAVPVTHCCFYCYCDSHWFIFCCDFLLISFHFIHLFSILLPVCFNKFSVQCSLFHIGWSRAPLKQFKNVLMGTSTSHPSTSTSTNYPISNFLCLSFNMSFDKIYFSHQP